MAEKPIAWFVTCLLWAGPVFGFSVSPQIDCPTQVRAIASEVREPEGATTGLSKQTIIFAIEESIKGAASGNLQVELLKFGPLVVEIGRQYFVQMNQGKLCWLELVE